MFGIRTPAKKSSPSKAGPSACTPPQEKSSPGVEQRPMKPVRRSVDEIEIQGSQHQSQPKTSSQTLREGLIDQLPLPLPAPSVRCSTAVRSCEVIRQQMGTSRNLRRDLKAEVERRLDLIERIVRSYEDDRKKPVKVQGQNVKGADVGEKAVASTDDLLLKKIEMNERLLRENGKMMKELKDKIENQDEREKVRESRGTSTYAGVAGSRHVTQLPERGTLHSVVVESKDDKETAEQVMDRLRKIANEDEEWVKVERVRKAKDKKVIIGYRTEDERKKAQSRLAEREKGLTVQEVTNKDPLLKLFGVLKSQTDEELLKAVRSRNREVFRDLQPGQSRMSVLFRRSARNPHMCHVVLRVSPAIWTRALGLGRLHIDLQPVRVEDQSPLVQCSLCLGYGHSRRFCTGTESRCSHCGGLHLKTDCPDYVVGSEPTCINCTRGKLSNTGHNAFDDSCPIRKKWEMIARATTQYRC